MKILVIPDVHGRTFWKQPCENINNYDKVVFLGDYLDPYELEHIKVEDAINNFTEIIKFKTKYYDKVILLLGNHDLHYWSDKFLNECGGCRMSTLYHKTIKDLFWTNEDMFNLAYETEHILFTHAGYMQEWATAYSNGQFTIEPTADSLNALLIPSPKNALCAVSHVRGGNDNVGSCVWSDVSEKIACNESNEFINITGVDKYQIFGHTLQLDYVEYYDHHKWVHGKPVINKFWSMLDNGHAYEVNDDNPFDSIKEI